MKKHYFLILLVSLSNFLNSQVINIPDAAIKKMLLSANEYQSIAMNSSGQNIKIDTNNNGEIEVEEALKVSMLRFDFSNTSLSNILDFTGINKFTSLHVLSFRKIWASTVDLRELLDLEEVSLYDSSISSLDVSGLKKLIRLRCPLNGISNIGLNSCDALKELTIYGNNLSTLDVSSCEKLENLNCSSNLLTSLNVEGLAYLKEVSCNQNKIRSFNFGNTSNIETLYCEENGMTTLDVSMLSKIKYLYCSKNELVSINIKELKNLQTFNCSVNKLISLDVTSLTNLSYFYCGDNLLSTLFVNNLTNLGVIDCTQNKLTSLDLTNLVKLTRLECSKNEITSLDFKSMNSEYNDFVLFCAQNKFSTLDLSSLKRISSLYCPYNPLLETINIKNGGKYPDNDTNLDFSNNPNLNYICQDDNEIYLVQDQIQKYGYKNCTVNSYCSFVPGGKIYIIDTKNRFDTNNNGCDELDIVFPNLKLKVSGEIGSDNYFYNNLGTSSIPVPEGNYTLTPILENPDYYTVSPESVVIDFPSQVSPFKQSFCVISKGSHTDLEISILPVTTSVPGFDSKFKIVFKNKGNFTQSGTVKFKFNDAVLDYISTNIIFSTHVGNDISWNFSNLLPFESREIDVTFRLNKPTDTPALNSGDVLNFTAEILSQSNDETPNDNTFTLNQTVVGSYDPNDKICLEGEVITPSLIGEYVHYMIRFENTGTYKAQNIVVKDMIDLSKFDISTLVPTSSSHSFVTKISEGNKVEFIFEGINLPFDDATNDGYIAFKIKTKPTLKVDDSFTNDANIYFDYNFPILTNKATSTFKSTLTTQDFDFSNYFALYPNPSSQILNISKTENIDIQSFEIYDVLGQIVLAIPNAKITSSIDISRLRAGNYFIKVKSDKGSASMKFIKN
ncbi:DUF7619 domain-containing protein [Flavobacterium nitrogenifigens]|uniref:Conserved repeat domain-containing protein/Por secretion system C-terminal sorting domain-containing protein n=1 Tax=Flavobacterium nitrogenifigens TaxID=1617283 RepID=A0A521BSF8_9FLAO|nr:T9SS type A sorting domain-containing protein [Flavobacterium nitrogenifigens]KAF2337635.1 T9SS type A sorting domain-containing protein [Flavobacterium nitrogenifigens]SMO50098.1 conserved repeat domain-containing protein/Por secretion system C-terminal sorting domain-containing protein [Flavobacterium nitrogenifigens]